MTLHISLVADSFVFQVGDRLLTKEGQGRRSDWGPYANKSIYADAINGRVATSYGGLAHVLSDPTDQWLTTAISGVEAESSFHPGGPPTRFIGGSG